LRRRGTFRAAAPPGRRRRPAGPESGRTGGDASAGTGGPVLRVHYVKAEPVEKDHQLQDYRNEDDHSRQAGHELDAEGDGLYLAAADRPFSFDGSPGADMGTNENPPVGTT
jgi:hypothetical protein